MIKRMLENKVLLYLRGFGELILIYGNYHDCLSEGVCVCVLSNTIVPYIDISTIEIPSSVIIDKGLYGNGLSYSSPIMA